MDEQTIVTALRDGGTADLFLALCALAPADAQLLTSPDDQASAGVVRIGHHIVSFDIDGTVAVHGHGGDVEEAAACAERSIAILLRLGWQATQYPASELLAAAGTIAPPVVPDGVTDEGKAYLYV